MCGRGRMVILNSKMKPVYFGYDDNQKEVGTYNGFPVYVKKDKKVNTGKKYLIQMRIKPFPKEELDSLPFSKHNQIITNKIKAFDKKYSGTPDYWEEHKKQDIDGLYKLYWRPSDVPAKFHYSENQIVKIQQLLGPIRLVKK